MLLDSTSLHMYLTKEVNGNSLSEIWDKLVGIADENYLYEPKEEDGFIMFYGDVGTNTCYQVRVNRDNTYSVDVYNTKNYVSSYFLFEAPEGTSKDGDHPYLEKLIRGAAMTKNIDFYSTKVISCQQIYFNAGKDISPVSAIYYKLAPLEDGEFVDGELKSLITNTTREYEFIEFYYIPLRLDSDIPKEMKKIGYNEVAEILIKALLDNSEPDDELVKEYRKCVHNSPISTHIRIKETSL